MRVDGVRLSLWRAAALYRVVTLAFCAYLIFVRWPQLYQRPGVAYAVGAAMIVVTAALSWLAVTGRAHRPTVVLLDLAATAVLTLMTIPAQTAAQQHGGMPTLTTVWAGGPVLEAGFLRGWPGGLAAGVLQGGAAVAVRAGADGRTWTSLLILLVAGATVGYVATLVIRSEAELSAAVQARTAIAERDRLARTVHDGVLQVLALVHRTGRDAGGDWGRLAREAGAQEARLRALISSRVEEPAPGSGDVMAALRALGSDRVTVSGPTAAPLLTPPAGAELVAAVRAALHNVEQHAGAGARAWILVEELDDTVRVTVRDDGTGFPAGRLAAARECGAAGCRVVGARAHPAARRGGDGHLGARRGDRDRDGGAGSMTRVVLVDDHPIWRDALERDLVSAGFEVVGTFGDGEAAVRTAPALRPDVVLMDLFLPGMSGVQAAAALVAIDPAVRILMFSSSAEDADVLAAVKVGARGYLVKSTRSAELTAAVRRTAEGRATFSPGLAALVLGEYRRIRRDEPDPAAVLTDRETEILRMVSTGRTARQIAAALVLSHRTVQNHVQNTLRKLQLHNKVELTRWAVDHGLAEEGLPG